MVGCGNLIRGDDAAGPVLVRLLAERGVPPHVRLVDAGTAGMDVAFAMRGVRRVVVVDASRIGVAPGTLHHVPGEDLVDLAPPAGNLHQFRWDQALGFARWLLKDDYPEQVEVWLVEGQSFEPGAALTPVVAEALEQVADAILASVAAPVPEPPGPELPPDEEVLAVEASVVQERGRFVVLLDVLLATGAVRRRGGEYPDRERAERAARIMVRNARRHLPPPQPDPPEPDPPEPDPPPPHRETP